jgi:hypothetical protein
VEKVLRSKVLHLQQQVDELNAKQVDLLQQKQALQVRQPWCRLCCRAKHPLSQRLLRISGTA